MCKHCIAVWIVLLTILPIYSGLTIVAQENPSKLPVVYSTDFEDGASEWSFVDEGWKVKQLKQSQVLSQYLKKSDYQPKFRSPLHMALLKDIHVSDFQLDVRVHSTHPDYNHRDVCLFFGFQSPTQFYYVHLGKQTDPHANQIFIVNKAARSKISLSTTAGTPWDDQWHRVRIKRDSKSGEIEVYFDNLTKPVMTAVDKTFSWGQVGLGSFDDTADWDDFALMGERIIQNSVEGGIQVEATDK